MSNETFYAVVERTRHRSKRLILTAIRWQVVSVRDFLLNLAGEGDWEYRLVIVLYGRAVAERYCQALTDLHDIKDDIIDALIDEDPYYWMGQPKNS